MSSVFRYERLRDSKAAFRKFERDNGKVGSVAMAAFILEAARITGRSAKAVERIATGASRSLTVPVRRRRALQDGAFLIGARRGKRPTTLGRTRFQNRGTRPAVVILETQDRDGNSHGVQFVVLRPGDVFETMHNSPAVVVLVIVIGLVVIIFVVAIRELMESMAACKLFTHTFMADHCSGSCPRNPVTGAAMRCTSTGTGPYFRWGTQDTGCACV